MNSSRARTPYPLRLALGLAAPLAAAIVAFVVLARFAAAIPNVPTQLAIASVVGFVAAIPAYRWVRSPLRELAAEAQQATEVVLGGEDEIAILRRSFAELRGQSEQQLGALKADREHLLAIVSSMSEGVLVVDQKGKAVIVNPRWRELFGLEKDIEGATPIELTRQTRLEQLVQRTLQTGVGDQEEIDLDLPQAKTIIATSSALSDRTGAVVVARDITDFLRLAEIRRDFVANVSHELKTPLSAIRGLAETLKDGALDDPTAARHFVGRILRQSERLEALLSDLLTLSRLEHPHGSTEKELVDLGNVIGDAVEVLATAAKKREISIGVRMPDLDPIRGDREALDRLVLNLLENAIKYNRPGGEVSIEARQHQDHVELRVSDTGIGIPADSLDRLFERFYRVDKGRSREEGGTGLGLAIVKHATQLHNGQIEVESRLGSGTTFRVLLPRWAAHPTGTL